MKKVISLLAIVLAAVSFSASAQRAGELNMSSNDDWNRSGVFAEIGLGAACGDIDTDLGFSVGLGYRYHFGNGLFWDIIKVAYYNPSTTEAFEEGSSMRFLTGVRYNSAPLLAGKPIYANFAAGYQLNVYDTDYWKGFAYEFGVGVQCSRSVSVGIMWEGNVCHYSFGNWGSENANMGIVGLKLGIQF